MQSASLDTYVPPTLQSFEESLRLPASHAAITPISSPEDNRQYRVITLPNNLTALLISDPETEKSAASLDVNIGSFAEPSEALGLAHFLEHMLFMGTQKYPDENSYSLAINNHGGSQNAFTAAEHTNYIFDVSADHLEDILDRFAQFFISPLCLASAVEREMLAVNNENERNLQSDVWRINQIAESAVNPKHPLSRFATGNLQTLRDAPKARGMDIRETLMKFYHEFYSANLMKLAVCGKEDLDTLEKWVKNSFSAVPNRNITRPDFTTIPLVVDGVCQSITRIIPVKNRRSLEIEWFFDATHHLFLSEPSKLLVHVLATEAQGSLSHYLKQRSLINELYAHQLDRQSSYSLGMIRMELTEAGLEKVDDILEYTFATIEMIMQSLKSNPAQWKNEIWNEVGAVERMEFQFREKNEAIWFCEDMSGRLSYLPAKYVLSGGNLQEFHYESLVDLARVYRDVTKCRVRIIASEFKTPAAGSSASSTTTTNKVYQFQKEQWYGAEYATEAMSAELIARLANPRAEFVSLFHLPKFNPFIATDFALKHTQKSKTQKLAGEINEFPKRIVCNCHASSSSAEAPSTPLSNPILYFAADTTFSIPKVDISVQLSNSFPNSHAVHKIATQLYCTLIEDALSELEHYGSEAGMDAFAYSRSMGLRMQYRGFSHKLGIFLKEHLPALRAVRATNRTEAFARLKEQRMRSLLSYTKEPPLTHARDDLAHCRTDVYFTVPQQLEALKKLTPVLLDQLMDEWLAQGQLYVLVSGNATEQEAQELTAIIAQHFPLHSIVPSDEPIARCVQFNSNEVLVRQIHNSNTEESNSCCINSYQIGVENEVDLAHLQLWSHILSDAVFDQLRTRETLGYMVRGWQGSVCNIMHYHVAVQSSDANAEYLNLRIEAFLHWFRHTQLATLVAETPDFLDRNKKAVILLLTEKDKNLNDEASRRFEEIEKRRYDWNRDERIAKQVESITVESFHAFYDRYLLAGNSSQPSQRKKLSVQYFARNHALPSRRDGETEESVKFANEKLQVKSTTGEVASPVAASASAAPASSSEEIFLPPAVVDFRKYRYIDDIQGYKNGMPLFPAML